MGAGPPTGIHAHLGSGPGRGRAGSSRRSTRICAGPPLPASGSTATELHAAFSTADARGDEDRARTGAPGMPDASLTLLDAVDVPLANSLAPCYSSVITYEVGCGLLEVKHLLDG
jgi:hypothetical protein